MKTYALPLAATVIVSLAYLSPAQAASATSADFVGKTICWGGGSISSYGAGGKYSNNLTGEGTWSMSKGGLHIHTDRYDYVASVQKLPDGTFHAVIPTMNIKTDGKYCK